MIKKYFKIFLGIALTIILTMIIIITAFAILTPIVNNISAKNVMHDICLLELPPSTKRLEELSHAGKLIGNGNGMQYFGAILIESDLSLVELDNYYSQYRNNEWTYVVEKQEGQSIQVVYNQLSFKTNVSDRDCYIVYSWGDGISPFNELDLRGH